jgi:hypothetical protein
LVLSELVVPTAIAVGNRSYGNPSPFCVGADYIRESRLETLKIDPWLVVTALAINGVGR